MNKEQKSLTYNWHHSIDERDRKSWESIFKGNILKSFDFYKAQCEANIKRGSIYVSYSKFREYDTCNYPLFYISIKIRCNSITVF